MTDPSEQNCDSAGGGEQRHTPPPVPVMPPARPPRRRSGWRVVAGILIVLLIPSVLLNAYLVVLLSAGAGRGFDQRVIIEGDSQQTIAVYAIKGLLDGAQADRFGLLFHELATDPAVKALVLRVESPGGGISPSDQIHGLVRRLQKDVGKPVVVSMGGVAASGGYYVSAPAATIFAEPTTITGSIGVLANWVVLRGTLEKIGAEPVVMRSDAARGWKDEISPFHKPTDRQRKHIQGLLNAMQDRFETVVRLGRGDKLRTSTETYALQTDDGDTVRHTETAPFNGKVYLADEAKRFGLIDAIGGQQEAVAKAAELAGLVRPHVVHYTPRYGFVARLLFGQAGAEGRKLRTTALWNAVDGRELLDELQTPRLEFIWKAE